MSASSLSTAQSTPLSRLGVSAATGLSAGVVYAAFISFTDDDPHHWRQFLVIAGFVVVTSAIAFAVARRAAAPGEDRRRRTTSVVLAVLAFLSLGAFWACVWAPLAAAAVGLAVQPTGPAGRGLGRGPATALALSAITTALAVVAAVIG